MNTLDDLRARIDAVDRQLTRLLCERFSLTDAVGRYKTEHGLPVMDGTRHDDVLAQRAAWSDVAYAEAVRRVFLAIMEQSRERQQRARLAGGIICLTGLPGCGKTTLGKAAAQALGRQFIDLDAEIERDAGMRIAGIFAGEGEAGFRQRETQTLARVLDALSARDALDASGSPGAAGTQAIIALGGGTLHQASNRELLCAKSARIVFIDRPIEAIAADIHTADRPLLSGGIPALKALAEARREGYERYSDAVIANNGYDQTLKTLCDYVSSSEDSTS